MDRNPNIHNDPFGYRFDDLDFDRFKNPLLPPDEGQQLDQFFQQGPLEVSGDLYRAMGDTGNQQLPPRIFEVSTSMPGGSQTHHGYQEQQSMFAQTSVAGRDFAPEIALVYDFGQSRNPVVETYATQPAQAPTHSTQPTYSTQVPPLSGLVPLPLRSRTDPAWAITQHPPQGLRAGHMGDQSIQARLQQADQYEDPREREPLHRRHPYAFGSDPHFSNTGFVPQSHQDTEQVVTQAMIRDLKHAVPLSAPPSAGNTSPPSPAAGNGLLVQGQVEWGSMGGVNPHHERSDEDHQSNGIKRKRGGRVTKTTKKSAPKQRQESIAHAEEEGEDPDDDRPTKKTRGKPKPRLTAEQRRLNHILSEQKRRRLIQKGFDDLDAILPTLRTAKINKSNTLLETERFIKKFVVDNDSLERMIEQAKALGRDDSNEG